MFYESDVNCIMLYVMYLKLYIYVIFDVMLFYVLVLLFENGGVCEVWWWINVLKCMYEYCFVKI